MIKVKTTLGICPLTQNEQSITINYVSNTDFSGTTWEKGNFDCNYSHTHTCNITCPLFDSAPEIL